MPPLGKLAIDAAGISESRICRYDFSNIIQTGDTILSNPAPVITQVAITGQPALTFTSVTVTTASTVQARVSVTSGTAGTIYETVCRATTTAGDTLECFLDIQIIGPS